MDSYSFFLFTNMNTQPLFHYWQSGHFFFLSRNKKRVDNFFFPFLSILSTATMQRPLSLLLFVINMSRQHFLSLLIAIVKNLHLYFSFSHCIIGKCFFSFFIDSVNIHHAKSTSSSISSALHSFLLSLWRPVMQNSLSLLLIRQTFFSHFWFYNMNIYQTRSISSSFFFEFYSLFTVIVESCHAKFSFHFLSLNKIGQRTFRFWSTVWIAVVHDLPSSFL